MNNQALLVAPYIHDFAAFDLWLKPVGLLYVAAAAEAAGYCVRVVNCVDRLHPKASGTARPASRGDGRGKLPFVGIEKPECLARVPRRFRRYGIPLDVFRAEAARGPRPDVIGVGSMMTYWCGGVAETISILREVWPGVPVILGGVYATLCPAHARRYSGADIVVEGRGENRFVEVLRRETGRAENATARPNPPRPAYHLLEHLDSVSMLTSYGCPFSCAYCASKLLRPEFIQRPVAEVVDEIACYAAEMGIRHIAFYDDALLVNAGRHIKPILHEICGRELDINFHTPNGLHANMIDEELADLMRMSGFATVRLSVESIEEARLEDSCRKVTPEGFGAAVARLFSAGYGPGEIEAYVMMGAPRQRAREVEATMRFVHDIGAVIRLADFSPIPGTPYFAAAVEEYGLDPDEPLLQNGSALPHLVPGMAERYRSLKELAGTLNSKLARQGAGRRSGRAEAFPGAESRLPDNLPKKPACPE